MPNPWTESGDPCADIPDAPEPDQYEPAPGERWRVGRKVPRNLYRMTPDNEYGEYIGVVDTPELARLVVEAVNEHLGTALPDRGAGDGG